MLKILICPNCKSPLKLEIGEGVKRIISGKLLCGKCKKVYEIKDEVVYFKPHRFSRQGVKYKNIQRMFFRNEINDGWLNHFKSKELSSLKSEMRWMISKIRLSHPEIHLDWATGTGRFLRELIEDTESKFNIIALEIDPITASILKDSLKKADVYDKVTVMCCDARKMPFAGDSMDSISSWHGVDEPNMRKAINESRRILKTNGRIVLSGLFYEENSESLKKADKYKIDFTREEEVEKYFRALKFKNIEYKEIFRGVQNNKKDFIPQYGDLYTSYGISGQKS